MLAVSASFGQATVNLSPVPLWPPPPGSAAKPGVYFWHDAQMLVIVKEGEVVSSGEFPRNAIPLPRVTAGTWDTTVARSGEKLIYGYQSAEGIRAGTLSISLAESSDSPEDLARAQGVQVTSRQVDPPVDAAAPYMEPVREYIFTITSPVADSLRGGLLFEDSKLLPGFIPLLFSGSDSPRLVIPENIDEPTARATQAAWNHFAANRTGNWVLGPRFQKDESWLRIVAHYYHMLDRMRVERSVDSKSEFVIQALAYWNQWIQSQDAVPLVGKPSIEFTKFAVSKDEKMLAEGWKRCVELHQ